jgi:hypothetical protein
MNDPFLNIFDYSKAHLVEMVMALHGRGSSDPKLYRRILERMDAPALRRALSDSDYPNLETEAPMTTAGESPASFPPSPEALPVEQIEANPCGCKSATGTLILHSTLP